MLEIALDYARKGWFVFPAPPGEKMSCVSGGKTNGNRWGSTSDPKEIKDYFNQFPNANIGIATGLGSKIWVSEADTLEGHKVDGIANLRRLEAEHGPLPDTLQGESPSGSIHYFWEMPEGKTIYNSTSLVAPGIDVLGEGGMVIAPPSVRPGKGVYKWLNSFPVVQAPDWLFDLAAQQRVAKHINGFEVDAEADPAMVAAALAAIPNDDIHDQKPPGKTQKEYNNIGMACWRATGGSEAGFEAFDTWARKSNKYHGGTKERWQHYFKSPPTKIGAGTLFYLAQEADPNWRDNYAPERIVLGEQLTEQLLARPLPSVVELPEPSLPELVSPFPILKEFPTNLLNPPGLVGLISRWITDTALYPQPALSLGAALTIVGTAAGRHLGGPNRCGTHLYVVALAPTGAGKNHPLTQISTILTAANMQKHVGPSQFISMPSVINFLKREPLSVCAMDEFGSFLKRTNSKRASGFEGAISGMLRTAWGASFTSMSTPEWAQSPSVLVHSPAMSIYGASTPREFYESLEGADIINGVLNRFLIIETAKRPKEQPPLLDATNVPKPIIDQLREIYDHLGGSFNKMSVVSPAFHLLDISPDAEKIRRDFVEELQDRGDKDDEVESFLARTAENALRLATIVTIGLGTDCIEADVMTWARDFAQWSSNTLAESAGLYISDSETQAMANAVRRVIQKRGNGTGRVKRADVLQALKYKYKTRELADVIAQMAEGGTLKIEKTTPAAGGTPSYWYSVPKR
jgi:hypothetical protein